MPNAITDKEYWDKYWGAGKARFANYDKSKGLFHAYHLLLSECISRTQSRLGHRALRLVDCGCGEGLILRFVHEQFPDIHVSGIEYSDSIDKARRMAEELGYEFNLVRGDLFQICRPGRTDPFDVMISLGLIEHFEDPASVLAQLSQMVVPGGCVITIIPNFQGAFNLLWKLYDPANYARHVPISWQQLLAAHRDLGLDDVRLVALGTPTIPGINDAVASWQKALNWMIAQVNGRVLQRLWPRQASLTLSHAMTPAVACIGWKPLDDRGGVLARAS